MTVTSLEGKDPFSTLLIFITNVQSSHVMVFVNTCTNTTASTLVTYASIQTKFILYLAETSLQIFPIKKNLWKMIITSITQTLKEMNKYNKQQKFEKTELDVLNL